MSESVVRYDELVEFWSKEEAPLAESSGSLRSLAEELYALATPELSDALELTKHVSRTPATLISTSDWLGLFEASQAFSAGSFSPDEQKGIYSVFASLINNRLQSDDDWLQLRSVTRRLPKSAHCRIYAAIKEAYHWKSIEQFAHAKATLAWINLELAEEPTKRPFDQESADLIEAEILMVSGNAHLALKLIDPWIEYAGANSENVRFLLAKTKLECALGTSDRQGAIDFANLLLSGDHTFKPTEVRRIIARRGTAYAEESLSSGVDSKNAREDLTTALSGPPSSRYTWVLAHLALTELELEFGSEESLLKRLELAAPVVEASKRLIARMRMRGLLVQTDLRIGVSKQDLEHRLVELEQLWHEYLSIAYASPPHPTGNDIVYSGDHIEVLNALISASVSLDPGSKGTARALDYVIDLHMAGELVRGLGLKTPSITDLQRTLTPTDGGVLVYIKGRKRSHVFLLDAQGIEHNVIEAPSMHRKEITNRWIRKTSLEATKAVGLPADAREFKQERKAAAGVSELLFPEHLVQRVQDWSSISFVGADHLILRGLEWLPLGEETYLGHHRDVWDLPSLVAGTILANRAREEAQHFPEHASLLVAGGAHHPSQFHERWPATKPIALPTELWSSESVTRAFTHIYKLEGEQLTNTLLTGHLEQRRDVAQLFMHAVEDSEGNPERPTALALSSSTTSPSGLFYTHEMARATVGDLRHAAPRFAILTACRSEARVSGLGNGIGSGLGSAFLLAGSNVALSSSTNLNFVPAQEFARVVLEGVADGMSPAQATRAARVDATDRFGAAAPFLFNGLRLVGAGGVPLLKPAPPSANPLIWLFVPIPLCGLALLARARGRNKKGAGLPE